MTTTQAVAFGGDIFLAVGRNGCALVSRDAREWRACPLGRVNLHDVAYGGGRFVAVSERDTILLVGREEISAAEAVEAKTSRNE